EEERQQGEGTSSAPLGQHGLAGHSQNEVDQGLREFARNAANPREFRETVDDFAAELAEQGYATEQEGMGRGRGKQIDTDILYYMKLAESYHLPVRKAPLEKSSSHDPYAHTPWELGKPVQDIDVWTSFGKILPGLTQTWVRRQGEVMGRREGVPDCIVIIDSSGSITNLLSVSDGKPPHCGPHRRNRLCLALQKGDRRVEKCERLCRRPQGGCPAHHPRSSERVPAPRPIRPVGEEVRRIAYGGLHLYEE